MATNLNNLILSGACGRMGREIIKALMKDNNFHLIGALENENCVEINQDAAKFMGQTTGIKICTTVKKLSIIDNEKIVLIDFSSPKNTIKLLDFCISNSIRMVIGTTGFSEKQLTVVKEASKSIPILCAPNMSLGVNKVFAILKEAVKHFEHGYDIEIFEAHHRSKLDAPSGTALKMGEIIADSLRLNSRETFCFSRHDRNVPRKKGEIGFSVIRGGNIIGEHKVIFAGHGEKIEITHDSNSREGYALGALEAATFLMTKKTPGFFGMEDII